MTHQEILRGNHINRTQRQNAAKYIDRLEKLINKAYTVDTNMERAGLVTDMVTLVEKNHE